jgi:uncharacterized protein YgbK (DUF1537 family)
MTLDTARIISELKKEIDRLDKVIAILDSGDAAVVAATADVKPRANRRKRRHLTAEGRAKLSKLMRARWELAKKKGRSKLK